MGMRINHRIESVHFFRIKNYEKYFFLLLFTVQFLVNNYGHIQTSQKFNPCFIFDQNKKKNGSTSGTCFETRTERGRL